MLSMANPNPRTDQIEQYQFKSGKEAAKAGAKGGVNSGKSKRKKASLMRCAQRVLESDITPEIKSQIERMTGELDDENDTLFTAAAAVMVKEAIGGNVQAFRELKDLVRDMDGAYVEEDTEEDGLSKALREWGESL